MKLVNLTLHAITYRPVDGQDLIVPPSGTVARVDDQPGEQRVLKAAENMPILVQGPPVYGSIENLPEPDGEHVYIVSMAVRIAAGRPDVVSPGTGPNDGTIREPDVLPDGSTNPNKGKIVAVTRFIAGA